MRGAFVLLLVSAGVIFGQAKFAIEIAEEAEIVAEIELSSPGSDWGVPAREAAVATVRIDSGPEQHIFVYSGETPLQYAVSLGRIAAGVHELTIMRDDRHSAPESQLKIAGARFRRYTSEHPDSVIFAHAPILFARKNTIGRFSDVPMLVYCERLPTGDGSLLQYTAIFSNEDGGTSTRALMARWGRTTDIEYVYRVRLDASGKLHSAIVQGPEHRDLDYKGKYEGAHPLLMPITDNNMIGEVSDSPLRFQPAPRIVTLDGFSREELMDRNPVTYRIASKELEREGKLRPFGIVDGEKISDPRNYLIIEYLATHQDSAFSVSVLLKNGRGFTSDLGHIAYGITRNGWVRSTVELPPGTRAADIADVRFTCQVALREVERDFAHSGNCRLEKVGKVFFLNADYAPGPSLLSVDKAIDLPAGQFAVFRP